MKYYKAISLLLMVIISSEFSFCQEISSAKTKGRKIVKLGKSIALLNPELLTFSILTEYENQFNKSKRFSSSYSMRYDEGPFIISAINNGKQAIIRNFKRNDLWIKYDLRYYPFLLKNKSLNLLYLQSGPLLFNRNINGTSFLQGPGFDYGIGVQIILWNKIAVSCEVGRDWVINLKRSENSAKPLITTIDRYYNVKIGYVFRNRKKN